MSSSLPSASNDYAAPHDMALTRANWNAALTDIASRLRALEALGVSWEQLVNAGTAQALEMIAANVGPELEAVTEIVRRLETDVAEAEDVISSIISGSVPMGSVTGLSAALALLAALDSPEFVGTPKAPTADVTTDSTQIATTKFVHAVADTLRGDVPANLNTLAALAQAVSFDPAFGVGVLSALANRVRVDGEQSLTDAQKAQAQANLGVSPIVRELFTAAGQQEALATLGAQASLGFIPVDKGGDTMTGNLVIKKASPGVNFVYPGVRAWNTHVGPDGEYIVYDDTSGTKRARFTGNGDVVAQRYVSGTSFRDSVSGGLMTFNTGNRLDFHWNNGLYYRIDGNQYVFINSLPSDAKLKENIAPLTDALAKICAIEPKTFQFRAKLPIAHTQGVHPGLLAQEVAAVLPTAITTGNMPPPGPSEYGPEQPEFTGEYLRYADDADKQLIALLIGAVRELAARVEALETAPPAAAL